jgi:hypothetical protein
LGKLDLVIVGMKMICPETPWWEDDVARINDALANTGIFFCGRSEEGRGGGGSERARGVRESFFSAPFLWLYTGFLFFGVECKSRNHAR